MGRKGGREVREGRGEGKFRWYKGKKGKEEKSGRSEGEGGYVNLVELFFEPNPPMDYLSNCDFESASFCECPDGKELAAPSGIEGKRRSGKIKQGAGEKNQISDHNV